MRKSAGAAGVTLIFLSIVMFVQPGHAFWGKKKQAEPQPSEKKTAAPVEKPEAKEEAVKKEAVKKEAVVKKEELEPASADTRRAERQRIERQRRKEQLNNTAWDIEIKSLDGKARLRKDTLIFEDNLVCADRYVKEGFNQTNYSITIQEDGIVVWETMQTKANGENLFWRGELDENITSMRGAISLHKPDGVSEDFSFVSVEKKSLTQERAVEKKDEKQPESPPAGEAPKSRKR